jgi:hypothetical protein
MTEIWENIPTWDNGTWTETSFSSREELYNYIKNIFLEPGKYEFDETSKQFNAEAEKFNTTGVYCTAPFKSRDFISYWDDQKAKCRKGVLFKNKGKTWYLTREYYMWLNFLPIFNKELQRFGFANIRDAQYHMALYEFLAELDYKHVAVLKKRQIASEQPHSEPILTVDGWRTMGDIQIGDQLWNPDGTLTTIINKTNNGLSDVYEFEFGDGRSTRAGIEHNWAVYDRTLKKEVVLNTKQLLEANLYNETTAPVKNGKKVYKNYRFAIKYTNPIQFLESSKLEINPYVLGCLLGDGSIKGNSISLSSADPEIIIKVAELLGNDYILKENFRSNECIRYSISYKYRFSEDCLKYKNGKYGCNPLSRYLEELNLKNTTCKDKFIPEQYLHAPVSERISLLQGLMDTDGYINSKGKDIHYTTVSSKLADDVLYIARSLGIKAIISIRKSKNNSNFYRVRLSGHIPFNIFSLQRKVERFQKRKDSFPLCNIVKITKLEYQEESSCIIVDNPNRLYITKDFIVTHNSYYHMAKLINQQWFEAGVTLKIGASLKDYINEKGSWKFLDEYAAFLNQHTAWYRPMNPGKVMMWQQKIEVRRGDRKTEAGLKGTIQGMSFEKDPTNGVGGPVKYFFHEEAGIAPKMDKTYEYMRPAMRSGFITTGVFIAAGSVGDLSQCIPLKDMILNPISKDIYPIETTLIDDKGTIGLSGLFIPEQWSMPPFIDQYGNSLVDEALKALDDQFQKWKKELSPEDYQLRISQHPRNIKEAFDHRSVSVFPTHLVSAQEKRIEEKEYAYEFINLDRDATGKVIPHITNKLPINQFPVDKKLEDKTGSIVVWERPVKDPSFGMYYASIDPVSEGKSTTSDSLCSIYVIKAPIEVTKINGVESESYIEQDRIVAAWCGRFDDINKTHQRLEMIIEWYNAWTVIENNISLFIQYMISRKKQKYLVPKTQIMFLKDLGANANVFQEYGWKNTGRLFKDHLLSYAIEYTKEELDTVTKPDGTIVKTVYGIERIPDPMLLKEMREYVEGLNVDRLVSFAALIAFMKIQQSNRGYSKRVIMDDAAKNLEKSNNLFKLNKSPFHNVGKGKMVNGQRFNKSPFKNLK